ncbi:RrF2 family transcriptional regulator [Pseudoduganella sp. GCM10020061]|jgi:Rrf2 family nitric oxide-sensitive transcriptional repressor|uniref:RrF2 family transcriptional regulator n=1 Tax=Pseudoduganella sp. GCM10020061 TaxID=3317345 RepID=UPI00362F46E7
MRLTDYTDYALRVLMYLGAHRGRLVTIQEIATMHGISRNHLSKVVHRLAVARLVATVRGRTGGLRLARDPGEITVGEVVRLTEPDFMMVECFDEARNQCSLSPTCILKRSLARATRAFLEELDALPLAAVLIPAQQAVPMAQSRLLTTTG